MTRGHLNPSLIGRGRPIVVGLGLLALIQVAWLIVRPGSVEPPLPIEPLAPIEYGGAFHLSVARLDGSGSIDFQGTCWVVFVIDPQCSACRRVAAELGTRTLIAERSELVWISAARTAETQAFADSFQIPRDRVGVIRRTPSLSTAEVLMAIEVFATPTRLVLAPDRTIVDQLLTWQLPDEEELYAFCG